MKNFETDLILVDMEELQRLLCCGRRRAEKIGMLAKAEVRVGRMRRWSVQKIKEFVYDEAS